MLLLFCGFKSGSISIYIHEQSMTPPSIDFCCLISSNADLATAADAAAAAADADGDASFR